MTGVTRPFSVPSVLFPSWISDLEEARANERVGVRRDSASTALVLLPSDPCNAVVGFRL
jgi:hypothetical protein